LGFSAYGGSTQPTKGSICKSGACGLFIGYSSEILDMARIYLIAIIGVMVQNSTNA
jgi:hypothetical protein